MCVVVFQVAVPGRVESVVAIRGNRWLCEVRSLVPEDQLAAQQTRIQAYAKSLEQLVRFTKLMPAE